jgi:hypothetical protein
VAEGRPLAICLPVAMRRLLISSKVVEALPPEIVQVN